LSIVFFRKLERLDIREFKGGHWSLDIGGGGVEDRWVGLV
jgi:hypothetical protein